MPDDKPNTCPRARGLLSPAYAKDPYPLLKEQRESGGIFHEPVLNFYQVPRAATIEALLKDSTLSRDPHNAAPGTGMRQLLQDDPNLDVNLLNVDPPMHTRLRRLISRAFTPKAVQSYKPRVRHVATNLLDTIEQFDDVDMIARFASPLPTIVMAELLGADPAEHEQFKRWTDLEIRRIDPFISDSESAAARAAGDEFLEHMYELIARNRAEPGNNLIGRLILAQEQDDTLSDREVAVTCRLLLSAGNQTTRDAIGNALFVLAERPDQYAKLRANPALIEGAVEEVLRFESPVVTLGRIPMEPREIEGYRVDKGQSLNLVIASANRDPAFNDDPDQFNVERTQLRHLTFGAGIKFCVGAHLARLEMDIALQAVVARFGTLALVPGVQPVRRFLPGFRGLESLRLRCTINQTT